MDRDKKELQRELDNLELKKKELSGELDKLEGNIRTLTRQNLSLNYGWVFNKWFDFTHVYNKWTHDDMYRVVLFKPTKMESFDQDSILLIGVRFEVYKNGYGEEIHDLTNHERHRVSIDSFKNEFKKEIGKGSSSYKEMVEIINKQLD
jgi:hypothetical protein